MGVLGLTSFVAQHERALATPVTCDVPGPAGALAAAEAASAAATSSSAAAAAPSNGGSSTKTLVVDAWSFIYHHWLTHFGDALRGGDYVAFQEHVARTVSAWRLAALHPIFVFDGPHLPAKIPTILRRRGQAAASNSAFMRSSASSRRSRRFQAECGVIPPLLYWATIEALSSASPPVETVFAPTEADSMVAELAEQTRGYAVSFDSDFFILCARGGQSAGYVSLRSFEYLYKSPAPEGAPEGAAAPQDDDDGFAPVTSKKRGGRKAPISFGIPAPASALTASTLPPDPADASGQELAAVRFSAYASHSLAKLLQLPPSLLPLFAAFVGNDYSRQGGHADVLFRHVAPGPERVLEVADVLRTEWDKTGPAALARKQQQPAMSGSGMSTPKVPVSRKGMGRQGPSKLSQLVNGLNGGSRGDASSDSGFSGASSAAATPTGNRPQIDRLPSALPSVPVDPVRALVDATIERALNRAETVSGRSRYVASGEKEQLAQDIIEGAATYSLLTSARAPYLASPSAAFFGAQPSDLAFGGPSQRLASRIGLTSPAAIGALRAAYEKGHFDARLVEALTQRLFISRLFVEDPDTKSAHVDLTRLIRAWTFAALFDAWGMSWARETMEEPKSEELEEDAAEKERRAKERSGYREGERPDDVISVDTESSYSLTGDEDSDEDDEEGGGSLSNSKLLNLPTRPGSVAELMEEMDEEEARQPKPPPAVTEWVRKGERFTGELVQIHSPRELLIADKESGVSLPPSLAALLGEYEASRASRKDAAAGEEEAKAKVGLDTANGTDSPASDPAPEVAPLLSLPTRLDIYLHAHGSCTSSVKALPRSTWPLVSSLRHILLFDSARLGESRRRFAWTKNELRAAISGGLLALARAEGGEVVEEHETEFVDPTTRAIHLGSTLQLLLETNIQLAQALLLVPEHISPWPHHYYDGRTFHHLLVRGSEAQNGETSPEEGAKSQSSTSPAWTSLHESVYAAILDSDETLLAIDVVEERRERKEKKKRDAILAAAAAKAEEAAKSVGNAVGAGKKAAKRRAEAARNAFAALGEE